MKKIMKCALGTFRSIVKPDLKMKLTYLFFLVCLLQTNAKSFGQGERLNLDIENETIETVFNHIETLTQFRFLYNVNNINLNRKVSISAVNQKLEKVLQYLFKDTNVNFILLDRQIVLKTADNHKSPITKSKTSKELDEKKNKEQREISGFVYDQDGIPLLGVSVLVKGTQRGVATDFDGKFQINASTGETLVFSYVGYLDNEIVVDDDDNIYDVFMTSTAFNLDEILLYSTGYQTINKERATGSFEQVTEEVLEIKTNQNILSKIQGEVPGLLVNPVTGEFLIRGQSTLVDGFNDSSSPLIVIDGFPLEGGTQTINPNDVESISVLKDAAAASIWGIRAANGVIVITTKKGETSKKIQIEASITTAFTPRPNLFKNPLGSPQTQIDYQRAIIDRDFSFRQNDVFTGELNQASIRQLNPVMETLILQQRGDISEAEANERIQRLAETDVREEYNRLVLRPELWNQYNVALSGGGEKHDFRSSIILNQNQENFNRISSNQTLINLNNGYKITRNLKFRTSANLSFTKSNNQPKRTALIGIQDFPVQTPSDFLEVIPITSGIIDSNGNYLPSVIGANAQSSQLALESGYAYPSTYNIKEEFDNANNVSKTTSIRLQAGLDYEPFDGFNINVNYQYEQENINVKNLYNENVFLLRQTVNALTPSNSDGSVGDSPVPLGSILDLANQNNRFQTFRLQTSYDKVFNEGLHKINFLGGYEVRKTIVEGFSDRKYGFNDNSLVSIRPDFVSNYNVNPLFAESFNGVERIPAGSNNTFVENRFLSYYANAAYILDGTYTLTASARLDDTNLFGVSDELRNVPLFSVGLKWDAWKDLIIDDQVISQMEIRATYGTNGNIDRSTSPFLQTAVIQNEPPFGNLASIISSLPNPLLRLEKTKSFNLGLDFGLFDDVLTGSVEYYNRQSFDVLADRRINPTLGFTSTRLNSGEILNEGFDIQLTANLINTANFSYSTTGIFSVNRNVMTRVEDFNDDVFSRTLGFARVEGDAINTLYSIRYAGLDRNGAPQFINTNGDIVDFRTQITDVNALVKEGTEIPRYYGSWINQLSLKGFFLRALTTFQAGHVFRYNTQLTYIPNPSGLVNVPEDFNRRWQQPGDENFTDIPAFPTFSDSFASGYIDLPSTDRFIDTASEIRLSQLSIGYDLQTKDVEQIGLQSFRLGIQMDNVAVWNFNKWDVDPQNITIPQRPTVTLSINTTF